MLSCGKTYVPVCRHDAVYHAITFSDIGGHDVRIAIGPSREYGVNHAQAQALIDGKWEYLEYGFDGRIQTGRQDSFYPEKYISVKQFMRLYIRNYY